MDIDECNLDQDNCDPNAVCENGVGNFTCVCLEGFVGNGTSCDIVPDKTSVAHIGAMSAGATIAWLLVASLALY
jgi:hypothetical protein|eukprot:COSAG03_NODE_765_length_5957_cov_38.790031_4_plen_74_part_00